jgi:hypothetical protein
MAYNHTSIYTYNSPKVAEGITYYENINFICNTGVYLTAIKPVLETIHEGWKTEVGGFCISCEKLSAMLDKTKTHNVCTQLVLIIMNKQQMSTTFKAVLHFYHTDDKVQVQGSKLISPGITSAMWILKHLIEPLGASHLSSNQESIKEINTAILCSNVQVCGYCTHQLLPGATNVRDQPIFCSRFRQLIKLEGQIGYAAELIADRDSAHNDVHSPACSKLEDTLNKVLNRLATASVSSSAPSSAPIININNTQSCCNSNARFSQHDASTQTTKAHANSVCTDPPNAAFDLETILSTKMKAGKSCDFYQVTVEHLRYCVQDAKQQVLNLLNRILGDIYYLICSQI